VTRFLKFYYMKVICAQIIWAYLLKFKYYIHKRMKNLQQHKTKQWTNEEVRRDMEKETEKEEKKQKMKKKKNKYRV
jgi:hypothetical protein